MEENGSPQARANGLMAWAAAWGALLRDSCINLEKGGGRFLHWEETGKRRSARTYECLGRWSGELYVEIRTLVERIPALRERVHAFRGERWSARTHVRFNSLGRRSGLLYVSIPAFGEGIPAFGGERRPRRNRIRINGLGRRPGELVVRILRLEKGFLHLEKTGGKTVWGALQRKFCIGRTQQRGGPRVRAYELMVLSPSSRGNHLSTTSLSDLSVL